MSTTMKCMFDSSQTQAFKDCPRKYQFKYKECLKKIEEGTEEHHANFGGAIHSALEVYYKGSGMEAGIEAFKKDYPSQLNTEDLAKTQENGIALLKAYEARYKAEDKKFKVLSVEEKIEFEILPGIMFAVKLDTVVENLEHGGIYSLEHKTTSKSLTYDYWGQFDPNAQMSAQTYAITKKYGHCAGVIVNAMKFGFRKRAYNGEPAGFHYEFQRQMINRNDRQINSWMKDTCHWITGIQRSESYYAMNTGQCKFCSYKQICQPAWDPKEDAELIAIQYEKHDPFEYLKGDE
jgi:hypothetical protein